ncbi:hypothetical protein JXR93_10990 [bacterium]|nr:hypothetical protein [bacterium]
MKQKYYYGAVLGSPVLYSLSPNLYNNYFKENNIDYFYNAIEVDRDSIATFFKDIHQYGYRFFNITQPLKDEIFKISDHSDDIVKKTQNGNLAIYLEDSGVWKIFNTDYYGFSESYKKTILEKESPKVALVGTGSVSKTVFSFLKDSGVYDIDVFSITGRSIPDYFSFKVSKSDFKKIGCVFQNINESSKVYDILIFASSHLHERFFSFDSFRFNKMISLNYQSQYLQNECKYREIEFFGGREMLIKQFEKNIEILKEFNIF